MSDTDFPAVATDDFAHLRADEARSGNIAAVRSVAETVRSTLGPTGLDKMVVSSNGSITVTNDGEMVLKELDVEHPAAQTIVEIAKSQAQQVGDGTTTAVLLAGELLQAADRLLDQGTHPTTIVDGYQRTIDHVMDEVGELVESVDSDNNNLLQRVAASSLTGKVVSGHAEELAALVLDATAAVTVGTTVDLEYLNIVSRAGASADTSELVHGAVLDEEPCHESVPTEISDANVLLLEKNFAMPEPETDVRAEIDSIENRRGFLERDNQWMTETVDHIVDLGVDAVFCQGRIDDDLVPRLAAQDVIAIEHIKRGETEFEFLQEVTGATAVTDPLDATRDCLGCADISCDDLFSIENTNTHGITLVARGSTEQIAEEVERSVSDAIDVITQTVADGRLLPGGGASEIELAARIREYASSADGRTQLVMEGFADALEGVPRNIARNAGLDPLDTLIELRTAHAAGRPHAGLNVATGEIVDMMDVGIIQPAHVVEQSVYNAAKTASIILKVDGVISAADLANTTQGAD